MKTNIIIALIIALILILIATVSTCQSIKSKGELRTKEAQEAAEMWESEARAYAETLQKVEEARRRADESYKDYIKSMETAEKQTKDAREIVEKMRGSDDNCKWLDERVPDRVRDIIKELYPGSDCI